MTAIVSASGIRELSVSLTYLFFNVCITPGLYLCTINQSEISTFELVDSVVWIRLRTLRIFMFTWDTKIVYNYQTSSFRRNRGLTIIIYNSFTLKPRYKILSRYVWKQQEHHNILKCNYLYTVECIQNKLHLIPGLVCLIFV